MNVILYSTHCPKCVILTKKLDEKNIIYQTVTDTEVMLKKGINTVPVLEVDGEMMDFMRANNWINSKREG